MLTDCRVQLVLCKDNANERNGSLLTDCRVQLVLCKDNANERNGSLLTDCRVQLVLCKDIHNNLSGQAFCQKSLCPALPNGPFGRAIRAVRRCNTACFRLQNGTYGQHAGNQPLSSIHFLPLRYGHRHCRRAGLQHAQTATGTKRQRWHTTIAGREPPPRLPFAEACRQRYQPATGGVGQSRFCSWKSMSACTTKNTSAGSKSPRPSSDALAHT